MTIKVGIVGCGYGGQVLVPAFWADPRVEVVAIAARSRTNAEETARKLGIPAAFDGWRTMLKAAGLDAVAVAVPPWAQVEVAQAALEHGLAVFAEKPLALDLAQAKALTRAAALSGRANMIDFNFRGIAAFQAARQVLRAGEIGPLRHVAVSWQVESYANRARLESWKTDEEAGGGTLSNFVSHGLDYLEWFLGPIHGLQARLAKMPGDQRRNETFVALALAFGSGAAGSLTMSAAAYRGSGHRLDFYGEDGTLVLDNTGTDYMRGFRMFLARRPDPLTEVPILPDAEDAWEDGRVLPASRLIGRFLDWSAGGPPAEPDFRAGLRVQHLIEAARCSHASGRWIEVPASGE